MSDLHDQLQPLAIRMNKELIDRLREENPLLEIYSDDDILAAHKDIEGTDTPILEQIIRNTGITPSIRKFDEEEDFGNSDSEIPVGLSENAAPTVEEIRPADDGSGFPAQHHLTASEQRVMEPKTEISPSDFVDEVVVVNEIVTPSVEKVNVDEEDDPGVLAPDEKARLAAIVDELKRRRHDQLIREMVTILGRISTLEIVNEDDIYIVLAEHARYRDYLCELFSEIGINISTSRTNREDTITEKIFRFVEGKKVLMTEVQMMFPQAIVNIKNMKESTVKLAQTIEERTKLNNDLTQTRERLKQQQSQLDEAVEALELELRKPRPIDPPTPSIVIRWPVNIKGQQRLFYLTAMEGAQIGKDGMYRVKNYARTTDRSKALNFKTKPEAMEIMNKLLKYKGSLQNKVTVRALKAAKIIKAMDMEI